MIFDPLWLLFTVPGLIIALFAQLFVWFAYNKYSRVKANSNLTGAQVADLINNNENFGVDLMVSNGKLNDYFNPLTNRVNISSANAVSDSVASIAVVAHEFGHVQQKAQSSMLFRLRTLIAPSVGFGANVGYILIILGLALSIIDLAWMGVILFSLTTVFAFLTLPIEIDASRRALKLIQKYNLIQSDLSGARIVLTAAALTYVAGLIQSLGQLLYFVFLVSSRSRE
ncbi:MAG: zinc metallopeptidase [Candidatus Dojkabacteria bacterium]|nr:MAG: zinc metallopeptidase [Candidatus Dojkabacteria bacterium]